LIRLRLQGILTFLYVAIQRKVSIRTGKRQYIAVGERQKGAAYVSTVKKVSKPNLIAHFFCKASLVGKNNHRSASAHFDRYDDTTLCVHETKGRNNFDFCLCSPILIMSILFMFISQIHKST
jgi:hypothetical protein